MKNDPSSHIEYYSKKAVSLIVFILSLVIPLIYQLFFKVIYLTRGPGGFTSISYELIWFIGIVVALISLSCFVYFSMVERRIRILRRQMCNSTSVLSLDKCDTKTSDGNGCNEPTSTIKQRNTAEYFASDSSSKIIETGRGEESSRVIEQVRAGSGACGSLQSDSSGSNKYNINNQESSHNDYAHDDVSGLANTIKYLNGPVKWIALASLVAAASIWYNRSYGFIVNGVIAIGICIVYCMAVLVVYLLPYIWKRFVGHDETNRPKMTPLNLNYLWTIWLVILAMMVVVKVKQDNDRKLSNNLQIATPPKLSVFDAPERVNALPEQMEKKGKKVWYWGNKKFYE